MEETLNQIVVNDDLIDMYEQHYFVNSLIDFVEEADEWNSRDILPAFPNRSCYIPIPTDNSSSSSMK